MTSPFSMKTFTFTKTDNALDMFNDQKIIEALNNLGAGRWEVEIRKPKRSIPQNSAMHLYFTQLAEKLNEAGFDKIGVLAHLKECQPWSAESVKRELWCVVQEALGFGKKTSKLKQDQIDEVYNNLNKFLAIRLKMESIPFPSMDSLYAKKPNK